MFKIKFNIIIFVLLFVITSLSVQSSNLYIEVSNNEIVEITPFDYNEYYKERFYYGQSEQSTNVPNRLLVGNNISLETESNFYYVFFIEDINFLNNYVLNINDEVYDVSFCNNDGVCQPCFEWPCENIENHLTCPNDCPSGYEDNYCDLKRDGVCDPDCVYYDFDCDECLEHRCIYDEFTRDFLYCADMGGVQCLPDRICDGEFTYSDDFESFCCLGDCITDEMDIINSQTSVEEELNRRIQEDQRNEDEFDMEYWFYVGLMILFIVISVIVVAVAETKKITEEHKIRNYVYNLVKTGYTIDQIESALLQQNIEKNTIDKILRKYKR